MRTSQLALSGHQRENWPLEASEPSASRTAIVLEWPGVPCCSLVLLICSEESSILSQNRFCESKVLVAQRLARSSKSATAGASTSSCSTSCNVSTPTLDNLELTSCNPV
ncbi:hypothetical protein MRB53_037946 [Persea americana]|nr:hypothetical protein MRB53_037946 [Persea americana]